MAELTFIAYILSLISIVANIWLAFEIKELKQQRKRDLITKRLNSVVKAVQPERRKSYWG